MSLKERVAEWGLLRTLKEACENELKTVRSLTPYEKKIIACVNEIDGGTIDPEDCFHIGDVIYHLRCRGMKTSAACAILLKAAKQVENDKG